MPHYGYGYGPLPSATTYASSPPPLPSPPPPPPPPRRGDGPEEYVPGMVDDRGRCAPVGCLRQGEQVEVRIRGNIWIVGFLVSSLHLLSTYLGQGYEVEYRDQRTGQAFRAPFRETDVRPYPR